MKRDTMLVRAVAIGALVASLPWIAAWVSGKGAFGFPSAAFVMLVVGPFLVAILVRSDREPGDSEE